MSSLFSSGNKRRSHTPTSSSSTLSSVFLSRLQSLNSSSPAVYYSTHTVVPRTHRSTEYIISNNSSNISINNPSPYDVTTINSPVPTPSTSWTSEMSALADKIRENHAAIDDNTAETLDRKSIAQGMKLVAIAADEYEDGNPSTALDIYLSGIDKILMALPNKTDPMTKQALREKLTSVEERVGILNIAGQHRQRQTIQEDDWNNPEVKTSVFESFHLPNLISIIAATTTTSGRTGSGQSDQSTVQYSASASSSSSYQQPFPGSSEGIDKFKRFGQVVINAAVTCAVFVKQSPLPDIVCFIFSFVLQLFVWIDSQYHVVNKAQDIGIECIKLILKLDEQYRLHELATETMYMFVAAGIKAAVAYKEAPAFRHDQDRAVTEPFEFNGEDHREECQPKPSSRWIW